MKAELAHVDFRREVRRAELEKVMSLLKPGQTVLEVGAGAGWQAEIMAERGMHVIAIDIPSSNYNELQVWPVTPYDGLHIPVDSGTVDVVFSSNVLEHVPNVEMFQFELLRVLRPGGLAINIMPTATWRIWTTGTFFLARLKHLRREAFRSVNSVGGTSGRRQKS